MDHWEFVEENYEGIRNLCRRMCRRRYDLVDDMLSDMVTTYVPAIFENWDPTFDVPPDKKAWVDLKWYCWKWMNRRMRTEVIRFPQLEFEEEIPDKRKDEHDLRDEVQTLLSKLSAYDSAMLSMHLLCSMTFEDIGNALDISKGTARNHYIKALNRAKALE